LVQVDDVILSEPFDSIQAAEEAADELTDRPFASHYLQNPLPGSKLCGSAPSLR
jgi:hypothetical protein